MTGTFGSLNTALTALQYNRVAMDVASNNIANSATEGYVRRRVESSSLNPGTTAMWSRYDGVGDGVQVNGTTRMTDALLDARSQTEHGKQSYLDTRLASLQRVESGIDEPSDSGVTAALAAFRNSWQDLESNPDQSATRNQVLATGGALADAIHAQATNVATEQATQRANLLDAVTETNGVAANLAVVNKGIADAKASGLDSNDLLDQRDVLLQKLSELTGGVGTVRADGTADVTVGGQPLVSGKQAYALTVTGGVAADGSDSGTPLALAVGGTAVATGALGGEIGATGELLTTTLPSYLTSLNGVAAQLADSVNALHTSGYDQDGYAGTALFSYDPANAAASLAVAVTDPRQVVATSQPGGGLGTEIAAKLGDLTTADSAYSQVVNGFATQVSSAKQLSATQQLVTSQVDGAREQLTGVNYDEETVNLVAAQHGYEAAARVMSTLDSVLDTLINRMGVG